MGSEKDAKKNKSVAKAHDVEELIRQAYLRTLSRLPSAEEASIASEHFAAAADAKAALQDLVWALVNTKEFILNH